MTLETAIPRCFPVVSTDSSGLSVASTGFDPVDESQQWLESPIVAKPDDWQTDLSPARLPIHRPRFTGLDDVDVVLESPNSLAYHVARIRASGIIRKQPPRHRA
jgi:hypothetical protein